MMICNAWLNGCDLHLAVIVLAPQYRFELLLSVVYKFFNIRFWQGNNVITTIIVVLPPVFTVLFVTVDVKELADVCSAFYVCAS